MLPSSPFLAPMKSSLNRNGFTYLMALMLVMVMGIMLGAVGQSWKTIMQREREEELIFRGRQIKDALTRWHKPNVARGGHVRTRLNDLQDLVQDPRTLTTKRHLRRLYTDPMTGEEWALTKDSVWGIIGVASTSQAKPLKVGGFPDDLLELADKQRYSDWLFAYTATGASQVGGTVGGGTVGGSNVTGSGSVRRGTSGNRMGFQ